MIFQRERLDSSLMTSKYTTADDTEQQGLLCEIRDLRRQALELTQRIRSGDALPLPGNVAFLPDGRAICRKRLQGDSRYAYGRDGFNFWVYASGFMYGNEGLFNLFLPYQEGLEPQLAFFIGKYHDEGDASPISLLPVPYISQTAHEVIDRFTVLGPDAAYFAVETEDFFATLRIVVDQSHADHADVSFSTIVENKAETDLNLFDSAYLNPLLRHQIQPTGEDRWFKQIRVANQDPDSLPPFVITVNEDESRFRSVTNRALVRRSAQASLCATQVCTSRHAYLGDRLRDLGQAASLHAGSFDRDIPLTVFNDNAIAADLHRFNLPRGAHARFDIVLSVFRTESAFHEEFHTPISGAVLDRALEMSRSHMADEPHALSIRVQGCEIKGIPDETLNHFMPHLINQVRFCARMKGFIQPSPNSLIGIRDVFQAVEGHLYDQSESARDRIREAMQYVLVDGRCPRQYSLPVHGNTGRADLRPYIDQGVWVISALYTFCSVTGDTALLREVLGYHRLAADRDDRLAVADERDSVLEHLMRIMRYLISHRDPETGLLRALYGDWNDAVDGLGLSSDPDREFGTGVSIMASLQLYQNCGEMLELLRRFFPGQYLDHAREYHRVREEMADRLLAHAVVARNGDRRIIHGWGDQRSYYVGSFQDSDGHARDSLTSNAFWIISGMLDRDPSMRPVILEAFHRLDSKYGLITFEPGFAPDCPGVGRVGKLPIGTAENAATYVHAAAFGINALFLMNEPREAWRQIEKILPFAPHQTGLSHTPFVMPNCYVHNPELNLTGQNMNDWQTGSSNVLLKLLIHHVFGFQPGFEGLRVCPASWSPFEQFDFRAIAHDRRIHLVRRTGQTSRRRIHLNGQEVETTLENHTKIPSALLPFDQLSATSENVVEIEDPAHD